jgi:hypothetical protein
LDGKEIGIVNKKQAATVTGHRLLFEKTNTVKVKEHTLEID